MCNGAPGSVSFDLQSSDANFVLYVLMYFPLAVARILLFHNDPLDLRDDAMSHNELTCLLVQIRLEWKRALVCEYGREAAMLEQPVYPYFSE